MAKLEHKSIEFSCRVPHKRVGHVNRVADGSINISRGATVYIGGIKEAKAIVDALNELIDEAESVEVQA